VAREARCDAWITRTRPNPGAGAVRSSPSATTCNAWPAPTIAIVCALPGRAFMVVDNIGRLPGDVPCRRIDTK